MTRKLIMLRHGQTEYNASGRMQGQMDTKLSDVGIRQAEAVARYMKGVNIGYVVSSDLSRAAETARIVASSRGLPVHLDPRLRETNLGDWANPARMWTGTTRGREPSGAITRCGHPPVANPASRLPGAPVT